MGNSIRLNLTGLDRLGPKTAHEIVVELRRVLGPLVEASGKKLVITKGPHRGDLNIELDSDTDTRASTPCGLSLLGEGAGEAVFVRAHQALRVCGPTNPTTRKRDTRRILTASWLLGPALANTAIHELAHFIANLEHVDDSANFMSIMGPPVNQRTMAVQREFWAGKKMFLPAQRTRLIEQLKKGEWLGGMTTVRVP
jgi:hypothetical protein